MEFESPIVSTDMPGEDTGKIMKKAGLFFFLLILLEIPVAVLIGIVQSFFSFESGTLISILMTQGYLLLAAVVYCLVAKQHPVDDLGMKKYRISTFFLSLLVLITASPMASWFNVLSQLFVENTTSTAILSVTQLIPAWLGVLIIGCLPGFVEETIYRGIIYSAFRKRSVLTGILVSALAFGIMHMNFNQMAYAIYLGLVFALLVEATGSLVSTMILHMIFNGVNTLYIYILPELYKFLGTFYPEYANFDMEAAMNAEVQTSQLLVMLVFMAPFAIGGLVLAILLLKAIAKLNKREFSWSYFKGKREEVEQTKPLNIWMILGMLICLVFCIRNM